MQKDQGCGTTLANEALVLQLLPAAAQEGQEGLLLCSRADEGTQVSITESHCHSKADGLSLNIHSLSSAL